MKLFVEGGGHEWAIAQQLRRVRQVGGRYKGHMPRACAARQAVIVIVKTSTIHNAQGS